ncbi:MAG TPA: endolytic transglycosylase MltG [Candidatus Paceibacterota bacterium]
MVLASIVLFIIFLQPVLKSDVSPKEVTIGRGDGLGEIATQLKGENLIQSNLVFQLFALVTLRAHLLKPGNYVFSRAISTPEIVRQLVLGGRDEVVVVIPEGFSAREIDMLLSKEGIIKKGELISIALKKKLEGYLFPDTYLFYRGSEVNMVLIKFSETFKEKVEPLLGTEKNALETLILASLIEKEVPNSDDRKIVAGILLKRLASDWPLQVDASICYLKPGKCYPLIPLDFKIDSPYNTYLYKGLPIAPIANPGIDAIIAVLHPEKSSYWFYLSDSKTGKTFFAKTLEEHNKNKTRVLLNP